MTDQAIREALCTKGVLASLSISTWAGNKLDKVLSDAQRTAAQAAAANSIRVHKTLLSDPRVKKPQQIAGEARRKHTELTLPWHYDGVGLLPADMIMKYDVEMGKLKHQFWEAVSDMQKSYGQMVLAAATELGSAFNVDDYPHVSALASRYAWNSRFERMPTTGTEDLRLSLPEEVVEIIQGRINSDYEHVVDAVAQRISDVVTRVLDRLKAREQDGSAAIHTRTIEALAEMPGLIDQLNITGNEEISAMAQQLRRMSLTVEDVKTSSAVRQDAIARLDKIKSQVSMFGQGE